MAKRPYSHALRTEVLAVLAERIVRIAPTQTRAAKLLGISRRTLQRKLKPGD